MDEQELSTLTTAILCRLAGNAHQPRDGGIGAGSGSCSLVISKQGPGDRQRRAQKYCEACPTRALKSAVRRSAKFTLPNASKPSRMMVTSFRLRIRRAGAGNFLQVRPVIGSMRNAGRFSNPGSVFEFRTEALPPGFSSLGCWANAREAGLCSLRPARTYKRNT